MPINAKLANSAHTGNVNGIVGSGEPLAGIITLGGAVNRAELNIGKVNCRPKNIVCPSSDSKWEKHLNDFLSRSTDTHWNLNNIVCCLNILLCVLHD